MQAEDPLLLQALGSDEPRIGLGCGDADRRRVGGIVLLASLHERSDRLRSDQLHLVSEAAQYTGPMVRRTARFHDNGAARLPLEEWDQLAPPQLALELRLAGRVDAVELE